MREEAGMISITRKIRGSLFSPSGRRAGFTLMELLVVMTIIVILAAMLLPALQQARGMAKYARWQGIKRSIRCDPDCVAYYTFEEGQGTETENLGGVACTDKSLKPEKLKGTLYGGPTWIISGGRFPGKTTLDFDGSDDFIDITHSYLMNLLTKSNGSFTLETWVRSDDKDYGSYGAQIVGPTNMLRGYLRISTSSGITKTQIRVITDYPGARNATVDDADALESGKWYHIVATVESSDNPKKYTLKMYLNGELKKVDSRSGECLVSPEMEGGAQSIFIAQNYWSAIEGYFFEGIIDEVAIYKRALSADEIKANYRGGKP